MATFEAVFADGRRVTFEAETLEVEDGAVVLQAALNGNGQSPVAAVGSVELLYVTDTRARLAEEEPEDDEDDDDFED